MTRRTRRAATRWAGGLVAVLLAAGCAGSPAPARTVAAAHRSAGGVAVTVSLVARSGAGDRVRVRFRPRRGFHVYSVELPAHGVDGLGIPTRIAVRGGLAATGRPVADRAVRLLRPAGLRVALPVYPDGPVTFTLPVRRTGSRRARVVVGYGACSARTCLIPVRNESVPLRLP